MKLLIMNGPNLNLLGVREKKTFTENNHSNPILKS